MNSIIISSSSMLIVHSIIITTFGGHVDTPPDGPHAALRAFLEDRTNIRKRRERPTHHLVVPDLCALHKMH